MTTEKDYWVTWRIKATRGQGYRDNGESVIKAANEEKAKNKLISQMYQGGVVDYPSAVEVTDVRPK